MKITAAMLDRAEEAYIKEYRLMIGGGSSWNPSEEGRARLRRLAEKLIEEALSAVEPLAREKEKRHAAGDRWAK